MHMGDNISTMGITSVLWRVFSTVWERILISACLVINNDEEISTVFVL